MRQFYISFLGLRPGLRIVEVGSGTGDFTQYLARLIRGRCEITGIEAREASLQAAITETRRAGLSGKISYKKGDANQIPIENGYADLTCCRTLLMHLPDPLSAVKEMTRITNPGGLVAAIEPSEMKSFYDPGDLEYTEKASKAYPAWLKGIRKLEGKDFAIGEKLPSVFRTAGLLNIRTEIQADAWLDIDPRRRLKDVRDQLRFEYSVSKETRSYDRKYLVAGGLLRKQADDYLRMYESRARRLLSDSDRLRVARVYGAAFAVTIGQSPG